MQFTKLLKFSYSNGKLDDRFIFSIPAGYSCPRAGVCRTFANRETGKILDKPKGNQIDYRCFAAMSEARSPHCRQLRWHNYEAITKQCGEDALLISMLVMDSIRQSHRNYELFRIHEAGDMFSDAYFRSWILTAGDKPFALLIHGVQRAGSSASKAVSALKKNGINGYNKMHRQKA
jgi:hypothetical protein